MVDGKTGKLVAGDSKEATGSLDLGDKEINSINITRGDDKYLIVGDNKKYLYLVDV